MATVLTVGCIQIALLMTTPIMIMNVVILSTGGRVEYPCGGQLRDVHIHG